MTGNAVMRYVQDIKDRDVVTQRRFNIADRFDVGDAAC